MADPKKNPPEGGDLPGVAPKVPSHRVLYVKRDPSAKFQPVGSYEITDAESKRQGGYLFDSIRAEHINKARAAAAPIPFFLEQTEKNGQKVED